VHRSRPAVHRRDGDLQGDHDDRPGPGGGAEDGQQLRLPGPPGFVLQGGDPRGTGTGGPGYNFSDELPKAGRYELGSLAMANAGPNTNGSQFFIISGPQGMRLPPQYSLFGKVVSGLDVVAAIDAIGTSSGTPKERVVIQSVTITETKEG
jgi:peptidylprolyl isomerase/peptidyl-prolyl cis-trans isomerase B (cyclophilin B)